MQKYTLIITEKPDAAQRIATALDVKQQPQSYTQNGIPYYTAERDKRHLVIVPAIGHLYAVTQQKRGSNYPVFEFNWSPRHKAEKKARHAKHWLEVITKLSENADTFIDACDYDIEGSLIGYNILKYACNGKETTAKRMKYSTLTNEELIASYQSLSSHLDFPLVEAGKTRHEVDWLYGINLTRALTTAYKKHARKYQTLSTGRVQGPTLKFLTTREEIITNFTPTAYWQIKAKIQISNKTLEAQHSRNPIKIETEASTILDKCDEKNGYIQKIETKQYAEKAPFPFDLGTLQTEAYHFFRYNPKRTLDIAQKLYLNALISYPRTNSQQLPPTINYRTILKNLNLDPQYRTLTNQLLRQTNLRPTRGLKTDSAHPAIYPTGKQPPQPLTTLENNILDLIIRRFLAAFGDNELRQIIIATININDEQFLLNGNHTIKKGWTQFYPSYIQTHENRLPQMQEGQQVKNKAITSQKNYTKPPPRYNPATLLRKMEQAGIGTKATRANIIQTLYDRKYIQNENIQPTTLGIKITEILLKHCPTITSTKLTRQIEDQMTEIQVNTETRENVLETTIEILKPVTAKLGQSEETTGRQLQAAIQETTREQRVVGACPNCKTGSLIIVYSKTTHKRFVGCTNYFNHKCMTSAPLPQKGPIKPTHKQCPACSWPIIQTRTLANHLWKLCLNPACPTKARKHAHNSHDQPIISEKPSVASIGKGI
jgi:DNA topoisomerase-1